MTQQIAEAGPTLLPYLENRELRLKLRITGVDSKEKPALLSVIEASGPFAQIIEGFITVDGHSSFSDVFILVQPDIYQYSPSELIPITNIDVEKLWQQAWAAVCNGAEANKSILPIQISANNRLLPLRSIFQCQFKERFFHPLCPKCGQALILCRDDKILHAAGLQGYSQSLERYLFCPACQKASPEAAIFYTLHEPADPPPHLHSHRKLIEDFSRLLAKAELADGLPCIGCDEATSCFGPQSVVHDRLKPLLFYPFFMMLQPAPKLNLLEFLELIAAAGYERVVRNLIRKNKPGRLRKFQQLKEPLAHGSGFLSDASDHLFIEVLYLKLCLLDELSVLICQFGDKPTDPVKSNSLESIWVDLSEQSARLPLFWSFSLRLIDRVGRPSHSSFLAEAQKRYFLGLAWCYTLLVDDNQDMDRVQAAVDKVIFNANAFEQLETGLVTQIDDVFAPQHLLRATLNSLPPAWQVLWGRAVALGAELLRSGRESTPRWSADLFHKRYKALKNEIRGLLFPMSIQGIEVQDTQRFENEESTDEVDHTDGKIASILNAIIEDWPKAAVQSAQQVEEEPLTFYTQPVDILPPCDDGDVEETVILLQPVTSEMDGPCFEKTPAEQADSEKTVVVTPADNISGKRAQPFQGQDGLAPAIVAAPSKSRKSRPDPSLFETTIEPQVQGCLEKTIIISSAQTGCTNSDTKNKKTQQSPITEDELEKTVVITPDDAKGRKLR